MRNTSCAAATRYNRLGAARHAAVGMAGAEVPGADA